MFKQLAKDTNTVVATNNLYTKDSIEIRIKNLTQTISVSI